MKILLTGSNGYLGSHIKTKLSINHELITLSRSNADYSLDLTNNNFYIGEEFDCVIHCAGLAHTKQQSNFKKSTKYFFDVNVKGTINLFKNLPCTGKLKNIILISSVSVYGIDSGDSIDELNELNPLEPYGYSKLLQELFLIEWCEKRNITLSIFRLPLIVGKNAPGNLRKMITSIRNRTYFNINNISAKRSMVLAEDVANNILLSIDKGGVYNLTDGNDTDILSLSNEISLFFGVKIISIPYKIAQFLAKVGDVTFGIIPFNSSIFLKLTSNLTFSNRKACEHLDWRPNSVIDNMKNILKDD